MRVFHPVRNGCSALGDVHPRVVDVLLARRTGFTPRIIRAEPCHQAQRLFRDAEMMMLPPRAAGCRRDHADGLVIDALDLILVTILPRCYAQALGPSVGVALALDADEDGGRGVRMRFGIAPVLVLADPEIE